MQNLLSQVRNAVQMSMNSRKRHMRKCGRRKKRGENFEQNPQIRMQTDTVQSNEQQMDIIIDIAMKSFKCSRFDVLPIPFNV